MIQVHIRNAFAITRAAGLTPQAIYASIYRVAPTVTMTQVFNALTRMYNEHSAILRGGVVFLQPPN